MSEVDLGAYKPLERKLARTQWCLCELIWIELGRPYNCEPETKARCIERARRRASESAPSASACSIPPSS